MEILHLPLSWQHFMPLSWQHLILRIVKKEGQIWIETNWGAEKRGEFVKKGFSRSGEHIIFGMGQGDDEKYVRINLAESEDNVHFDEGLGCHGVGGYATLLIEREKILKFIQ